ncbi:MAG: PDDEXK nuclease domain-containing protein [Catalinimonas sp.]
MMHDLTQLTEAIAGVHRHFAAQAARQVNTALTLRNWVIGGYIVAYEQQGTDRAAYGERVLGELADRCRKASIRGMSETNLRLSRQFFLTYPQIHQTLSDEFKSLLPKSASRSSEKGEVVQPEWQTPPQPLLERLSFSHFIELLKADAPLKRAFYEMQTLKNQWSVRNLKRAMATLLFERTGLSTDRRAVLEQAKGDVLPPPADVLRNPYVLEFLNFPERAVFQESDLEQAIINHLQDFLLEAGRGFCFEARQKRLTFGNTHYRVDLVFYHRILKCHVLIDLKLGEFSHSDAGQMNVYLNYYREQEMTEGDQPPVGIILCAQKDDALVRYATGGLPQAVFVSRYLVNLPDEEALRRIVREEQQRHT